MTIGARQGGKGVEFTGVIDEVGVWAEVLTPEAIAELAANQPWTDADGDGLFD